MKLRFIVRGIIPTGNQPNLILLCCREIGVTSTLLAQSAFCEHLKG